MISQAEAGGPLEYWAWTQATTNCPHPCSFSLASVPYLPKSAPSFIPYMKQGLGLYCSQLYPQCLLGWVCSRCSMNAWDRDSASFVPRHPLTPPPAPTRKKGVVPCSLTKADPERVASGEEGGEQGPEKQNHEGGQRSQPPTPQSPGYAAP